MAKIFLTDLNLSKNEKGIWSISYRQGGDCDVYYVQGLADPIIFDEDADISQLSLETNEDCTLSVINVKGESIYGFAVTPKGEPSKQAGSKKPVYPGIYSMQGNPKAASWKCAGPRVVGSNPDKEGIMEDR